MLVQSAVQESPREALMREVSRVEMVRGGLERSLALAVEVGRAQGLSWTDVGEAFGVSRQAAFQRWGRKTAEQRAVEVFGLALRDR
jgi:hypothetical protein